MKKAGNGKTAAPASRGGVRRVRPKRLAFGHLWELGHRSGRLTAPLLRSAVAAARRAGADPVLALWGDRLF